MQVHESLVMDSTTTFADRRGLHISRTALVLLVGVILCGFIAAGLLVYNFAVCPQIQLKPTDSEIGHHVTLASTQSTISDHLLLPVTGKTTNKSANVENEKNSAAKNITTTESLDLRLPRSVKPISYDIKLIPFLHEGNFTFNGNIKILVNILEECKNITLHASAIEIASDDVSLIDSLTKKTVIIAKQYFVDGKQFYVIETKDILRQNSIYEISIKYVGILNDNMQGFYRSSYKVGNATRWIATTHFQPTDARRAFPCFDEPALKAKFNISIARPKNMTSLSNMRKISSSKPVDNLPNYLWDIYEESVPMSTYLVAFVVSDFASQTSGNFSVWVRSDAIRSASYALDIGPRVLKFLERFFNIKYPLPKMDMIALPDFSSGAMENWGLVTYRELSMLYEEGISTHINKQTVAVVVAHELAHQWFGNLVTPSWWSDLWLNEGFASYMEYVGVDAVEPTWMLMDQFVINELQSVFYLDALSTSHPISVKVKDPDEINEIFDSISYNKGAAIIRMMNHFLTSNVFKYGLTNYLQSKAFDSAEQDDLWSYLTKEARKAGVFDNETSVKEIMDTWTLQTGFPVVTVTRNYENQSVEFKQERFIYVDSPTTDDKKMKSNVSAPLWWIPLTYTNPIDMNFSSTKPIHWMRGTKFLHIDNVGVPANNWILANIQESGYYRVNYDSTNWNLLISHLKDPIRYKEIAASNRAQIIDDALNLARGDYLDYNIALNVSGYLKYETEYIPWKAAIVAMTYMDWMLMKSGDYDKFKDYYLKLLEKVYNEVGFEDAKDSAMLTVYKRVDIIAVACHLGSRHCVNQSIFKYLMWMNEPNPDQMNPISPNLKNVVYCTAIKYGGQLEWDFAWERFQMTTISSEKEILLSAMGCSREPWILNRYLERSMSNKFGIRKQDVFRVFESVSNNVMGQPITFNFIRNNWKRLKNYFGSVMPNIYSILRYSIRGLNTQYEVDELKRFADIYLKDSSRTVKQIIERSETNVAWMNKNYKIIINWLDNATISR